MNTAVTELLDSYLTSLDALDFIINCYLVAVGYRPLYSANVPVENEKLVVKTASVFPSLKFSGRYPNFLVHNSLWIPNHQTDREFGALLNYTEVIEIKTDTSQKNLLLWWAFYRNTKIPLNQHLVFGTTQVSQITNKVIELRLLLKPLNVNIVVELDPFSK